ncbi:MAG: C25 family cysteine peptidase [Planctomycetota bacterium]
MRTSIFAPSNCLPRPVTDIRSAYGMTLSFEKALLLLFLAWVLAPGLAFGALPPQLPNASGIRPISSSAQNLSLTVSLPKAGASNILMQAGLPHIRPGAGGSLGIGEPDVPVFGEWVLIPNGTELSIQVHPGKSVIFDNVDIAPVQPPRLNSAEAAIPHFTIDTITYSLNQDYPGVYAKTGPIKNIRGQSCTIVRLYPYQYNPVTRRLSVYEDLEVNLQFDGDIRPIPIRLKSKQFEAMLKRLTVNGDAVLSAEEQAVDRPDITDDLYPLGGESAIENFGNGQNGGCDYLIICDPDFEIAANFLAGWKRMSGFRTKVVTTNDTGVSAEEIESFIDESQQDWLPAPSYVLLLGDAEYIPCFYKRTHAADSEKHGLQQGEVASDRYYGDTNDDGVADLFVGRLPVNTAAEAQIAVERIINYERTPPDPVTNEHFYKNFAAVSYFEDYDDDGYEDVRFVKGSEDIYQFLTAAGCTGRRIYNTEPSISPTNWTTWEAFVFENDSGGGQPVPSELQRPDFNWNGIRQDVDAALTNGLFLITHLGHGSRMYRYLDHHLIGDGGWETPYFSENNAASLKNGALVPVLWSPSCETGWFDNETDREAYDYYLLGEILGTLQTGPDDESFCEELILNPEGGAVGAIGSTRISYGPLVDRMVWGWMDAIWPDYIESCKDEYGDSAAIYQMGPVFEYGKQYMLTKYPEDPYSEFMQTTIDEFIWFGDPTMEMWTAVPEPLTAEDVTHPASINLGEPTDVTVTVQKDSKPLAKARVTVSRAMAPDDYWTGLTNTSGQVTFAGVTTSQWGDYNVVVTIHNHIPYEGIIASAASGGQMMSAESQVSTSEDDGYGSNDDFQNLNADFLRVGKSTYNPPPYYITGMVFRNVNIPRGARIISASLKLRSRSEHLAGVVFGVIEAEATDNADSFGGGRHPGTLPKTSASVEWDLFEAWSEDTWYSSPDISDVIREVVGRDGWSANNSLAIFYSTRQREGNYRSFCSYDSNPEDAPKLQIIYAGTGS